MGSVQLAIGQNMELDLAQRASRLLKKTHMPPACLKQAFRIVALDRCGNHSRFKRSRFNVPPKYASARRFIARLASEIFLTSLQTAFFNNLLEHSWRITGQKGTTPWTPHTGSDTDPLAFSLALLLPYPLTSR